MSTQQPTPEPPRTSARHQQRREQILNAAAACFAREGFHGTSIATISRHSGMSAGHIYHFFTSKEAIIAALVEQRLEQVLEMVEHFESAEDVFQAMLDRVDQGLRERTDPHWAALELEILAEAARNPTVAAIVRAADQIRRARLRALIEQARTAHGLDGDADAITEVLMALFEGLTARVVHHPELDRDALPPLLRALMHALLSPPDRQNARFQPEERHAYESSLKYLKNVIDTARDEGREEGRLATQQTTALAMLRDGQLDDAAIARYSGLSIEKIARLQMSV